MKTNKRKETLMPQGVPKYIRCYDNGGETADRYTVVFTGATARKASGGDYPYLAMSAHPFHPQGFGQHGGSKDRPCDVNKWGFAPMMGKKNHLGTRITFEALPEDCRKLVISDYLDTWRLK